MKIVLTVALVLLLAAFLFIPVAEAQDIGTLLSQSVQVGEEMLQSILRGLQATDIATARAEAIAAVNAGERWLAILNAALALAPDDATRSTIEANIVHVREATTSANLAATGPDSEVKSRLDAARGEANEALTELRPLAPEVTPPTLPRAGGAGSALLAITGIAGAGMLLLGMGLRRFTVARS
ncbi:MAG: hypothetical protein HYY30_01665 [Chloroflexi bacterium]|nr:hypothetical protein [Chloroflexota bacterium]